MALYIYVELDVMLEQNQDESLSLKIAASSYHSLSHFKVVNVNLYLVGGLRHIPL